MTEGRAEQTVEERLVALEARAAEVDEMAVELSYLTAALRELRGHAPLAGEHGKHEQQQRVGSLFRGTGPSQPGGATASADPPPETVDRQQGVVALGQDAVDRGVPTLEKRTPTAWRGESPDWRRRAWVDLGAWVTWLGTAYRLEGSGDGWREWWASRGAVEELVALREWHRELVDVHITDAEPSVPKVRADRVALEKEARRSRLECARDWVFWHDALDRVVARVIGREGRDLLTRHRSLATPATTKRADDLVRQATEGFTAFLTQLEAEGEVGPPPWTGMDLSCEV